MTISYDEFKKVDLRVVTVITAERVEGSNKLLCLTVNDGNTDETGAPIPRQIIAGIGRAYQPETLAGQQITVVLNLEPRTLMGLESNGMILAAHGDLPVILKPATTVPPGSEIS